MGELVSGFIEFAQKLGKRGAVACILIGSLLVPLGLWMTFAMPGEAPADVTPLVAGAQPGDILWWPIMLVLSVLGVCMILLGFGRFTGTQRAVDEFLADETPAGSPSSDRGPLAADVDDAAIPFWVCGDCQIIHAGRSDTARCTECGMMTNFVAVDSEDDRPFAAAVLSS